MGSAPCKADQEGTGSLEALSLALEQADGKVDQGDVGNEADMQNRADEKPSITLSHDIWQRVAVHLTTKEWVPVSGTCKAMSKVQLPHISLETSAAGAPVWAAKHSCTMQSLTVKIHHWDQEQSAAVTASMQADGWDLRQLRMLHVWMLITQSTLWGRIARLFLQEADQDEERWMLDMLSSASNVEELSLMGVDLAGSALARCGFPPLAHLTELLMMTPLSPEVCSSIRQLPALQKLAIYKGLGPQDMQALPNLDLTSCSALKNLYLGSVQPSVLMYSPQVQISLTWQDSPTMLEAWQGVRSSCVYVHMKKNSMSAASMLSRQLREMFLMPPCLDLISLTLECKFIGSAELPLVLHLPRLVALKLISVEAHILFSDSTFPRELHITTERELDLCVIDVEAFAARIRELRFNAYVISQDTKLLLECFGDPGVWQKTIETQHNVKYYKICRMSEVSGQ